MASTLGGTHPRLAYQFVNGLRVNLRKFVAEYRRRVNLVRLRLMNGQQSGAQGISKRQEGLANDSMSAVGKVDQDGIHAVKAGSGHQADVMLFARHGHEV